MSANAPISPPLRKKALPATGNTAAAPKRLKIMTWNVAALRTIPSKLSTSEFQNTVTMNDTLAAFFKKYEVDIACIQEHKFSGWDKLDKEYACIEGSRPARV
jgi:mRNA deadenylase 3'-5' endonuclease subunit Ccr4